MCLLCKVKVLEIGWVVGILVQTKVFRHRNSDWGSYIEYACGVNYNIGNRSKKFYWLLILKHVLWNRGYRHWLRIEQQHDVCTHHSQCITTTTWRIKTSWAPKRSTKSKTCNLENQSYIFKNSSIPHLEVNPTSSWFSHIFLILPS